MQEIWPQDLDWDDILPTELCQRWNSFLQSYWILDQATIPRWAFYRPEFRVEHREFSDASQKAYGSAITAKTRVAPVKTVSLPRLKLCGALLLSEMAEAILRGCPQDSIVGPIAQLCWHG